MKGKRRKEGKGRERGVELANTRSIFLPSEGFKEPLITYEL
jgi:hypothetical protein